MVKGRVTITFPLNRKKELECYLKEGFPVAAIAKKMHAATGTIYAEIEQGTEPNEYKEKRYVKYSAEKSFAVDLKKIRGEYEDE